MIKIFQRLRRLPLSLYPRFFSFKIREAFINSIERQKYTSFSSVSRAASARNLTPLGILTPEISSPNFLNNFKKTFPVEIEALLKAAQRIQEGQFDILGSGEKNIRRGKSLAWHLDFKSGHEWNPRSFHLDVRNESTVGADIKVPWELSRCAHFLVLGQVYHLSKEEQYAKLFVDHIEDWIAQNPFKFGVNWCNSMEVALRACNWLMAWEFFHNAPSANSAFQIQFYRALYQHGQHIYDHLEWGGERSNNHYLANLLGLLYLGVALNENCWVSFSIKELEKEISSQTYSDGFHYEGSTAYHRFVTEIYFFAALLIDRKKLNPGFSNKFRDRLKKMFELILTLSTESGRMPLIGDNDSGRIHSFFMYEDSDVRSFCAMGASLFADPILKVKNWNYGVEMAWLFGFSGLNQFENWPEVDMSSMASKGAGDSGLCVFRGRGQLVYSAQPNGLKGMGNHSHNDKLSFVLSLDGDDFFIDAGTYLYTSDPIQRNMFRSTGMHNTVQIDNQEQNRFPSTDLFLLKNDAQVLIFNDRTGEEIEAGHTGYQRLGGSPTHNRKILKHEKGWVIEDRFHGSGVHDFSWTFLLGPLIIPRIVGSGHVRLEGEKNNLDIKVNPSITFGIEDGMYAPAYGCLKKTKLLRAHLKEHAPTVVQIQMEIERNTHG